MGVLDWLDLEIPDFCALLVAIFIGYLLMFFLPYSWQHACISVMVAYHLFLGWLVLTRSNRGLSLPIGSIILTHIACLGLIFAVGMARYLPLRGIMSLPFAGIIRYLNYAFPSLAIFEYRWLFTKSNIEPKSPDVFTSRPVVTSATEDYREWTLYLASQKPFSASHGVSMKDEYEKWLAARARSRSAASAGG